MAPDDMTALWQRVRPGDMVEVTGVWKRRERRRRYGMPGVHVCFVLNARAMEVTSAWAQRHPGRPCAARGANTYTHGEGESHRVVLLSKATKNCAPKCAHCTPQAAHLNGRPSPRGMPSTLASWT